MNRLLQAWRCTDNKAGRRRLRHWYNTALGHALAETEVTLMEQVLPDLFGYHLLQLGAPMEQDMLAASRINHTIILDDLPPLLPGREQTRSRFFADSDRLPLASASLDVLLLPHTLEYADNPHEILREVDRVLVPEGHVVILGFNPWSLFGLRRLVPGWRNTTPWSGQFFSATRIRDWLALLGFDTVLVQKYFFRPPLQNRQLARPMPRFERFAARYWPMLGGGYMLLAKKREVTLTPIRSRWRARRQVLPVGVVEPSARRNST